MGKLFVGSSVCIAALMAYATYAPATGIPVVDLAHIAVTEKEWYRAIAEQVERTANWAQQAADAYTQIEQAYTQIDQLATQITSITGPRDVFRIVGNQRYLPGDYREAAKLGQRGTAIAGGQWGTLSSAAQNARRLGGLLEDLPNPESQEAQDYDRVANINAAQAGASEELYNSIQDRQATIDRLWASHKASTDPAGRELIANEIALLEGQMQSEYQRYQMLQAGLDAERRLAEDAAKQRQLANIQDTRSQGLSW